MEKTGILRYIAYVVSGFMLAAGCAKISSPSGGPRDTEPPVVLKSVPENGARNFRGSRIVISFDEYVVLDKINEKFMVSPPMKRMPEIRIRGKDIVIRYEEELRDSTTYTFYFQDAVRDLNEGNPINNFQFVFSTGPFIDSLSVTGNVLKADDLNPPEATLVVMYIQKEDSAFIREIPSYIAVADKNGYFRIDNVAAREYRLYALKDADNSKNFNLPDEEIAFLDSTISVTPEKNWIPPGRDTLRLLRQLPGKTKSADTIVLQGDYKLYLFQHEKKIRYLTSSSRGAAYRLNYTLSLPPDSLGFHFSIPGAAPGSYFTESNKGGDSIRVWIADTAQYNRPLITSVIKYPFTDSSGVNVLREDTVMMRYIFPRTPARGRIKPAPFRFTTNISTASLKPGEALVFTSQTPFRKPDTSRIRLYELEGGDRKKIPFSLDIDSTNSCRISMKGKLGMNKNYIFIADSESFGNIYGEHSDSSAYKFTVKGEESYGKLVLDINNHEGSRIIQLLTEEGKIVREVFMNKDGRLEFPLLDKGVYQVRVIYDLNNDGKWTPGDFHAGRQPEPVSYMPQIIEIKENWVLEYVWDISEKNVKSVRKTPPGTKTRGRM